MKKELRNRTFKFSLLILELVEFFSKSKATDVIAYQIIKSGTSVGANYRAALRARSDKEFISKINIVLEEVDETLFWLEIIKEKKYINDTKKINDVMKEANELTAIFTASLKTINKRVNGF